MSHCKAIKIKWGKIKQNVILILVFLNVILGCNVLCQLNENKRGGRERQRDKEREKGGERERRERGDREAIKVSRPQMCQNVGILQSLRK